MARPLAAARIWAALAALSLALALPGCLEDNAAPSQVQEPVAAAAAESTVQFTDEGSLTGGVGNASPVSPRGCDTLQEEGIDVAHHPWEIPGEVNGTPVQAVRLSATLTVTAATLLDADLYLESPKGEVLAEDTHFDVQDGSVSTVAVEGKLEPGVYTLVVRACSGGGSYELAGEATLRQVLPEVQAGATPDATAGA